MAKASSDLLLDPSLIGWRSDASSVFGDACDAVDRTLDEISLLTEDGVASYDIDVALGFCESLTSMNAELDFHFMRVSEAHVRFGLSKSYAALERLRSEHEALMLRVHLLRTRTSEMARFVRVLRQLQVPQAVVQQKRKESNAPVALHSHSSGFRSNHSHRSSHGHHN